MFNKDTILKKLKYFGFTFSGILFLFLIIQYSGLIGLTKIKNVQIHGNRFIDSEKIENIVNILPGDDLLSFEIKKIQKEITKIEFIKSCRISRIFPSTLIVEIVENDPIAHVMTTSEQFILDKDGTQLPLNQSAINQFFLPTVRINKYSVFSKMELSDFATHIGHELFILRKNYPEIFNEINFFNFAGHGDVFMDFSDHTQIIAKENNLKLHFKILDEFKNIKLRLDNYSVIDLRVSNQLIVKENTYIKS